MLHGKHVHGEELQWDGGIGFGKELCVIAALRFTLHEVLLEQTMNPGCEMQACHCRSIG